MNTKIGLKRILRQKRIGDNAPLISVSKSDANADLISVSKSDATADLISVSNSDATARQKSIKFNMFNDELNQQS